MNRTLIIGFFLLSVGWVAANHQFSKLEIDESKVEVPIEEEPFGIDLKLKKVDNNDYYLEVSVELKNKDFIISPFSKDEFYGKFELSFDNTQNITTKGKLAEIPSSVEEMDPIINKKVKFVRTSTVYTQKIKINDPNDFEASGLIWFVLEPSCIPYDTEFTISRRGDKVEIKKTKVTISKEYKGN